MLNIEDIVSDKEHKSYWIHRTSIDSLYINCNSQFNQQPVLLSKSEYDNLDDNTNVFQLPMDFWDKEESEENSHYVEYLKENGITREMFFQKLQANYVEQLQSFFNNGLYSQRADITTTATAIDDDESKIAEKKLEKIIGKDNFGFVAGNSELAGLSHREKLNLLLVLEIPRACVETDNLQRLFEQASIILERDTTYFGIQIFDKVIPSQYIKCAIISTGKDSKVISNPKYDNEYYIQDGVYDESKLDETIKQLDRKPFEYDKILEIIKKVNNNFEFNKSYLSYRSRTDKILDTIYQNFDLDDRNAELCDKLLLAQEEARKRTRTPLETISEDICERDFSSMTEGEIIEVIRKLISLGTSSMNSNIDDVNLYFKELEAYRKGLEVIDENVMKKIINNSNFNDIAGNINTRKKLIEMLYLEQAENYKIIDDNLWDREVSNNNRTYLIKKALACSDMNISLKIINYINTNDMSLMTIEDCDSIVDSFGQGFTQSDDIKER